MLPTMQLMGANASLSLAAAAVAFATNILMSRELGPAHRGEIAFVLQLSYLITPFIVLGVDRAALRAESRLLQPPLTRHLVPLSLGLTALLLLGFRDARALAPAVALVMGWMAIRRSEAIRDRTFSRYVKPSVIYEAFILVGVLSLALAHSRTTSWWVLPYALPAVAIVAVELRTLRGSGRKAPFGHITRMSLHLMPAAISHMVVMRAERILLPALASNEQLGYYVAVAAASEPVYWLAQGLADHRAGTSTAGRRTVDLLRRLARDAIFFLPATALGAVLVWHLVIPLLGPTFRGMEALVIPLAGASFLLALYRQVVSWHLAGPNPEDVSKVEAACALLAIPVYSVGIYAGGAMGAAWACGVVYGAGLVGAFVMAALRSVRLG